MPADKHSASSAHDAAQQQADPQKKLDTVSRGEREEEQPGPSRVPAPRQGYCSCCQVLYNSVEQHILSPGHREVVRRPRTLVTLGSLMERFLTDVIQHHPHRYNDPRPTHSDLPNPSFPLIPREELSDLCDSDEDALSLGTRERMPSSGHSSCQLIYVQEADVASETRTSLPGEGRVEKVLIDRLTPPYPDVHTIPSSEEGTHSHKPSPDRLQTRSTRPSTHPQTPPSIHRKAHRKTNRRRARGSDSSFSSIPRNLSPASPQLRLTPREVTVCRTPENQPPSMPREPTRGPKHMTVNTGWAAWAGVPPWRRAESRNEAAFSSDHSDPVGDTIEEVIQRHCYGLRPTQHLRDHNTWTGGRRIEADGDKDSFHLSLPGSLGAGSGSGESEDWDTPVRVALWGRTEGRKDTPVIVDSGQGGGELESRDLACLMEVQVNVEDQMYTSQLDSALHPETRNAGPGEGQREPTVEEIFPALPHIPASFVGKTWTQVLQEDEEKVEAMVREFRQGRFLCYFESESLARYGKRSQNAKVRSQNEEAEDGGWVPLGAHDNDDDEPECHRRGREGLRRKIVSRSYRLASRCQVVKVSHGTQTTPAVIPTIRQRTLDQTGTSLDGRALPCSDPSADLEKTPRVKTRLCALRLPASYTRIMTPLQPKTALVYVLNSPETPPFDPKPRLRPIARGNRGRKRTCDVGVKVKYKRVPLRYYDPATHRVLKTPPKGLHLTPTASGLLRPPQSHVVRQLFRSLSPDINSEKQGGEVRTDVSEGRRRGRSRGSVASGSHLETRGSLGSKGQGSSEAGSSVTTPFSRSSLSNNSRFLLGTLTPDSTSNPEVTQRQGRRVVRGRKGRNLQTGQPPTTEKSPSTACRPGTPGGRRERQGGGRGEQQPVTRSSKRRRLPHIRSPPSPKDISTTVKPRRGPSRRVTESKKVPKSPAKASAQRATSTPPKQAIRTPGLRSSPRQSPARQPTPTLRGRTRR
ncbi:DBF4-type zinc finger-containing protein 2 [Esox lucius]|uniref:DBF4-type zinc finger-containing protein 2 n=1 Tax=Esox lucius TaxID=8010 RepID=UPI00147687AF|nr:DBF4-type zinc finger-containing protein 2 [Esox lucius]XP_010884433.2 DBF4-type zinc finger-containing protein 2 [Esox lucius]